MKAMVDISPARQRQSSSIRRRWRHERQWPMRRLFVAVVAVVVTVVTTGFLLFCGNNALHFTYSGNNHNRQATATNRHQHVHPPEASPATYHHNLRSSSSPRNPPPTESLLPSSSSSSFDAIVVGSGLAGLTTTLEILDRGGRVVLVEKEATLGGNSIKASSGINGCCDDNDDDHEAAGDSLEAFQHDTTQSAGSLAHPPLIEELVSSSASALQWLRERVGVDLSQVAQLGGHSFPRTHRPAVGMVGAELIVHLEQLVRSYEQEDDKQLTILTQHAVTKLLQTADGTMQGVQVIINNDTTFELQAPQVVLATGGFASDRRANSLLRQVRPDLADFGTTGGSFSTGDGIHLGTAAGARTIDMDQIQLHPTGFVDPIHPEEPTKVLAAELLRGVGGILLQHGGRRFCNELGTRDYVTKQMLANTGSNQPQPTFTLLLTEESASQANNHVAMYHRKGLLSKVHGLEALAQWMHVPANKMLQTLQDYESDSVGGKDRFGKTVFKGIPRNDWNDTAFYVGLVTPVLHYCMGGLSINTHGQVLAGDGAPIAGLFAAGEVTGGVHGQNRLGGNSLLECTVFGRNIGQSVVIQNERANDGGQENSNRHQAQKKSFDTYIDEASLPSISKQDLQTHSSRHDLWMAVNGLVYNLTTFAAVHPGGSAILQSLAGQDATDAFATVHSPQLLPANLVVARLLDSDSSSDHSVPPERSIPLSELKKHSTPDDCWVAFHGNVYDMTEFSKIHKGGAYLIQKYAGKDATETFQVFHKKAKLSLVASYRVGSLLLEDEEADTARAI